MDFGPKIEIRGEKSQYGWDFSVIPSYIDISRSGLYRGIF